MMESLTHSLVICLKSLSLTLKNVIVYYLQKVKGNYQHNDHVSPDSPCVVIY